MLSPQFVLPFQGALPVATSTLPVAGSTTAPERAQIAESLASQVDGSSSPVRFEQSEFQTCSIRPFTWFSVTTWPW